MDKGISTGPELACYLKLVCADKAGAAAAAHSRMRGPRIPANMLKYGDWWRIGERPNQRENEQSCGFVNTQRIFAPFLASSQVLIH